MERVAGLFTRGPRRNWICANGPKWTATAGEERERAIMRIEETVESTRDYGKARGCSREPESVGNREGFSRSEIALGRAASTAAIIVDFGRERGSLMENRHDLASSKFVTTVDVWPASPGPSPPLDPLNYVAASSHIRSLHSQRGSRQLHCARAHGANLLKKRGHATLYCADWKKCCR